MGGHRDSVWVAFDARSMQQGSKGEGDRIKGCLNAVCESWWRVEGESGKQSFVHVNINVQGCSPLTIYSVTHATLPLFLLPLCRSNIIPLMDLIYNKCILYSNIQAVNSIIKSKQELKKITCVRHDCKGAFPTKFTKAIPCKIRLTMQGIVIPSY
jgi:hypothetical protein